MKLPILLLFFGLLASGAGAQVKSHFKLPEAVREVSGLVINQEGQFIWHNDSGHEPKLYFTDGQGELLHILHYPGLPATDWEDITQSPSGDLFIGNFGSNCHCRYDLAIYILPASPDEPIDSINFHYPDQMAFPPGEPWQNFNMEAMFWYRDSLHLFSKNTIEKGNDYTKHYVIPAQPGNYKAILRDSFQLKRQQVVTGAAISPDGSSFALLGLYAKRFLGFIPQSKATIYVFPKFDGDRFFDKKPLKKGIRPYIYALQYEAIDFYDEETLVIGSEKTLIIPAKAKRIRLGKRFFR